MAVSQQFVGRNYWGMVEQRGPWKMTSQDYRNAVKNPITPGPAGLGRFQGDQIISFKDNYSRLPTSVGPPTRYAQYSIISGRGRSIVPAPAPYGGDGEAINVAVGYNSNKRAGDINYMDPAAELNIEGDAFGVSLNNEFAGKPLYPKSGPFMSQQLLFEQAIKQQNAPAVQLSIYEKNSLAEDFYDSVISGVAPTIGQVHVKKTRSDNLERTVISGPYETIYSEKFIPPRKDLIAQNLEVHSSLQARQDALIDYYNTCLSSTEDRLERSF